LRVELILVARSRRDLDEDDGLVVHTCAGVRTSAASRSAIRSSADSIPTESRTRLRGAAKGASAVDACVIRAGCSIRLSTLPSDSASRNSFVRATSSTASSSDSARKEIIPPKSRICGAALQRALEVRRGERVVDDEQRAGRVRGVGGAADVDQVQERVRRRLRPDELRALVEVGGEIRVELVGGDVRELVALRLVDLGG